MRTVLFGFGLAVWFMFMVLSDRGECWPRRRVVAEWVTQSWVTMLGTFLGSWLGFWLMFVLLH